MSSRRWIITPEGHAVAEDAVDELRVTRRTAVFLGRTPEGLKREETRPVTVLTLALRTEREVTLAPGSPESLRPRLHHLRAWLVDERGDQAQVYDCRVQWAEFEAAEDAQPRGGAQ